MRRGSAAGDHQKAKYIAVQIGARRGYAVPAILENAGMLERFYTDACGNVGLGAYARLAAGLPIVGPAAKNLANRLVPDGVRGRTTTFETAALSRAAARSRGKENAGARWGAALSKAGFGQAKHVFSMLGEGGEFLVNARRHGLRVVSEVYIMLSAARIVAQERQRYPAWEKPEPADQVAALESAQRAGMLAVSDLLVCPSAAVRDDLIQNWDVAGERTVVVPYGLDSKWLTIDPRPIKGRVLFVGSACLRKGIHYLAAASDLLAESGRRFEFRVAGDVAPEVRANPECRNLTFLGRVPRSKVAEEFSRADVFALPSLAEGSAEVTYEALGAAIPVITTQAAGAVLEDQVHGRIVPERDPAALAQAIDEIVSDRPLRNQMAAAARDLAHDYTWDRYGERLIRALDEHNA